MPPTIYDVARQAEVGIGTVSRVLNKSPRVSEATRQKVLAAIEELNYRPSPIAQRLSLRKTFTIGVITPFFTRPAFVGRLRGVEAALTESEYDLVLYNVETTDKRDVCFRQLPTSQRFDGLLLIALPPTDEDVTHFHRAGIPVVLIDAYHPDLSHVVIDDVKGGYMATKHLVELATPALPTSAIRWKAPFALLPAGIAIKATGRPSTRREFRFDQSITAGPSTARNRPAIWPVTC